MNYYLPSCKYQKLCPETARSLVPILKALKVDILDCCKPLMEDGFFTDKTGDRVITVCQACALLVDEAASNTVSKNIFELFAELSDVRLAKAGFSWPDYSGQAVILQDCWRTRNKPAEQAAVRKCLERMHIKVIELPEDQRGEKAKFDGVWLFKAVKPRSAAIAPKTYRIIAEQYVELMTDEEKQQRMETQVKLYKEISHKAGYAECLPVINYCNACMSGIRRGGGETVHLLSLMLGTDLPGEGI